MKRRRTYVEALRRSFDQIRPPLVLDRTATPRVLTKAERRAQKAGLKALSQKFSLSRQMLSYWKGRFMKRGGKLVASRPGWRKGNQRDTAVRRPMLKAIRMEERRFRDLLASSFTTRDFLSACLALKIDEPLKAKLQAKPYLVRRVIHDAMDAGFLPGYVDLYGNRYSRYKAKHVLE